jgi:Ca2+-binding EF-hand superfamily protein
MPTRIHRLLAATLAAAVAMSGPVAAAAPSAAEIERAREQLRVADDDGDGAVTRVEFQAHANAQWAKMDRDRDGYFTRADLPAYAKSRWDAEPVASLRRRADTNRDGRIARAEFRARHGLSFEIADINRNGAVSKSEMRALDRRIAAR